MTKLTNRQINDILLISIWWAILLLIAITLRGYYVPYDVPLWDSLNYQNEGLRLLRYWLDGDFSGAYRSFMETHSPGGALSYGLSFLIIGLNPIAPYIVSGLVGLGCIVAIYLLAIELGTSHRLAFWASLAYLTTPNFIYQNFLQTRNDFQAALLITISWVLVLRGIKSGCQKKVFLAGLVAGLAILSKSSAPGYILPILLVVAFAPKSFIHREKRERLKLSFYYICGTFLSSAWHYLPNLRKTIDYFTLWSDATIWKAAQYGLKSKWTDYLFYPENLAKTHLGMTLSIALIVGIGGLFLIRYANNSNTQLSRVNSSNDRSLILTLCVVLISWLILSATKSFSSLGDVPLLPMLVASTINLLHRVSIGISINKYILVLSLILGAGASLPSIPVIEKQFQQKSFSAFTNAITKFREEYGLKEDALMQVYSHPIYNIDAYKWSLLIDKQYKKSLPVTLGISNILFPEDPMVLGTKLERFPMLLISDYSGTIIGGETFHTFNRLHDEINRVLANNGAFIKIRRLELEDGKFPVYLALNKQYKTIAPVSTTADNWVLWGGEFDYFSYGPSVITWRGRSIRSVKEFVLVEGEDTKNPITFFLKKIDANGVFEYESEKIPGSLKLRRYRLAPSSASDVKPASELDQRPLAFYKPIFEIKSLGDTTSISK